MSPVRTQKTTENYINVLKQAPSFKTPVEGRKVNGF